MHGYMRHAVRSISKSWHKEKTFSCGRQGAMNNNKKIKCFYEEFREGVSAVAHGLRIWCCLCGGRVPSLAWGSGLRVQCCCSCSTGRSSGLDSNFGPGTSIYLECGRKREREKKKNSPRKCTRYFYSIFDRKRMDFFFQVNILYSKFRSMKCSLICEEPIWSGWGKVNSWHSKGLLHSVPCFTQNKLFNPSGSSEMELLLSHPPDMGTIFLQLSKSDRIFLSQNLVKNPNSQYKQEESCLTGRGWDGGKTPCRTFQNGPWTGACYTLWDPLENSFPGEMRTQKDGEVEGLVWDEVGVYKTIRLALDYWLPI